MEWPFYSRLMATWSLYTIVHVAREGRACMSWLTGVIFVVSDLVAIVIILGTEADYGHIRLSDHSDCLQSTIVGSLIVVNFLSDCGQLLPFLSLTAVNFCFFSGSLSASNLFSDHNQLLQSILLEYYRGYNSM